MIQRRDGSPRDWHSAEPRYASSGRRRKRQPNGEQLLRPTRWKHCLARIQEKPQTAIMVVDHEKTGTARTEKRQLLSLLGATSLLTDIASSQSVRVTDTNEGWDVSDYRGIGSHLCNHSINAIK